MESSLQRIPRGTSLVVGALARVARRDAATEAELHQWLSRLEQTLRQEFQPYGTPAAVHMSEEWMKALRATVWAQEEFFPELP